MTEKIIKALAKDLMHYFGGSKSSNELCFRPIQILKFIYRLLIQGIF